MSENTTKKRTKNVGETATPRTRFWVSWVQPGCDHRPLTYPPNAAILGWWCSGFNEADESILCALVEATDDIAVTEAIKQDWSEFDQSGWRFFNVVATDFLPGDRFPLTPWMQERCA